MKKTLLYFFFIFLFNAHSSLACRCEIFYSFCELTDENSLILEAEVIASYSEGLIQYRDFEVTEAIQNIPSFEFFSISRWSSCTEGSSLEVGDKMIVNFTEFNDPYAPDANYITTTFATCDITYLSISEDGTTVYGKIEEDLYEANYEDFKSNLDNCNDYNFTRPNDLPALILFPNPTTESVTISFGELEIEKINFELFSSSGQKMINDNNIFQNVKTIDLSNLPIGVYFLKVQYDEEELIERIVKY